MNSKERRYVYNLSAVPDRAIDPDTNNALRAFIAGIDIHIPEERYLELPDWMKSYWKPCACRKESGDE